jgi:hypothetical protein
MQSALPILSMSTSHEGVTSLSENAPSLDDSVSLQEIIKKHNKTAKITKNPIRLFIPSPPVTIFINTILSQNRKNINTDFFA